MSGFDTLNSSMDLLPEYKGVLFRGKVVDNNDPLNLGRIKVSIPNLYDPGVGDIPWCGPDKYSSFGQGNGWGVFGSPSVGSDVIILFQDGNPQFPIYRTMQANADPSFPSGGAAWGYRDPYGNLFRVGVDKSVVFNSASGVTFTIAPDGSLSVQAAANVSISAAGNINITAGGVMTLTAAQIDMEEG